MRLVIYPYVPTDPKRPLRKGFTLGELSHGKKKIRKKGKIRLLQCRKRTSTHTAVCISLSASIDIRTVTMMTGLCVTLPFGHAITKTDLTAESEVRGDFEPTTAPRVRHQIARSLLCPWPRTPRTIAERRLQNLSVGFHQSRRPMMLHEQIAA